MRIGSLFFALGEYSQENHEVYLTLLNASKKNKQQIFPITNSLANNRFICYLDQHVGLIGIRNSDLELVKGLPMFIKRVIDIIGSLCGGIILSPLFILIAIATKLQDGGQVFYRRRVIGGDGKTFNALKFRTMVENADTLLGAYPHLKKEYKVNFKLKNDLRLTCIGKLLRKLSLDEIPQLFNVLIRQMSLVGPRMVTPEELERYGAFKAERITVRPGLTGYWQVSGRQEVSYDERIKMDHFYLHNWNIWIDLWILLKTVQKVLKMEGAY